MWKWSHIDTPGSFLHGSFWCDWNILWHSSKDPFWISDSEYFQIILKFWKYFKVLLTMSTMTIYFNILTHQEKLRHENQGVLAPVYTECCQDSGCAVIISDFKEHFLCISHSILPCAIAKVNISIGTVLCCRDCSYCICIAQYMRGMDILERVQQGYTNIIK